MQSASVVLWAVHLNSSLAFNRGLLQLTIWSAGPTSKDIWNHDAEELIMFSECFRICYSSQINKNKLLKYFLSALPIQQIQKFKGKIKSPSS